MRHTKPHWPTRSTLRTERTAEHLISERALRERLKEEVAHAEQPDQLMAELNTAIEQSRIA